jgi:predicted DNA-binding transcriptional regulator AlpA
MPKNAAQIALAQKAAKFAEAKRATARISDDPLSDLANDPAPRGKRRRAHSARGPPASEDWASLAGETLLSKAEVMDITGRSYPTLWEWMRRGSFPRCRVDSGGHNVWLSSDVAQWMKALPKRRLKGDPPLVEAKRQRT